MTNPQRFTRTTRTLSLRSNTVRFAALTAVLSFAAVACGGSADKADEPSPVVVSTTAADKMTGDKMTGDSMTGEHMTGDSMTGDWTTGDKMTGDSMTGEHMTGDTMTGEHMTGDATGDKMSGDAMAAMADFQHLSLTDTTGKTFTLGDFVGKPVFVEDFATWCPKCGAQLKDTNAAAAKAGDQAVFIALSVETQLSPDDVAKYAKEKGFDSVRFAVMTPEFLAAITKQYGGDAANPPSTPHFIIDAKGKPGELKTGTESADKIGEAIHASM